MDGIDSGSCQVANVDVSSVTPHEFYQMLYSNWNSLGPVFSNPKIHNVSEMVFYLLQKTTSGRSFLSTA